MTTIDKRLNGARTDVARALRVGLICALSTIPLIVGAQANRRQVSLMLAASPQALGQERPAMLVQSLDGSPLTLVVDTLRATPRDVAAAVVIAERFQARYGSFEGRSRAQFRVYPKAADLRDLPYTALTAQAALRLDELRRAPETSSAVGRTRAREAVFDHP